MKSPGFEVHEQTPGSFFSFVHLRHGAVTSSIKGVLRGYTGASEPRRHVSGKSDKCETNAVSVSDIRAVHRVPGKVKLMISTQFDNFS